MFRSLSELFGYQILAKDGEIGKAHDFYFDDVEWIVRYMVVNTGPWILGRKVLIAPPAFNQPAWMSKEFPVDLTRDQIKNSPEVDTVLPVSKQQEIAIHEYYEWVPYWKYTRPVSSTKQTTKPPTLEEVSHPEQDRKDTIDRLAKKTSNLRSTKEVRGYDVVGEDGKLGKVADLIFDDDGWDIVYFLVDTDSLLVESKQTLVAIPWIDEIDFDDQEIEVNIKREMIEDSPPYDPETPINEAYEKVLYDYYGRPYLETEE